MWRGRGSPLRRWRYPALLALPAAAVIFAGCGKWIVEPTEEVFTGNGTSSGTVTAFGPGEFKIISQTLAAAEEHFKLESECAGKTLKPKEKEALSCEFKVKGENYASGSEANLTTTVENLGSKASESICTPLAMGAQTGGNLSGNVVIRPTKGCFPAWKYNKGNALAVNSTYTETFIVKSIYKDGEFEITETAPGLGAEFTKEKDGCTPGKKIRAAQTMPPEPAKECTFDIKLTTNGEHPKHYAQNLKVKFKIVGGGATVYEKIQQISGDVP